MPPFQKNEVDFKLIVESSPTSIVVIRGDGVIVFANRETERLFGYNPEELSGKAVEILIPSRYRGRHIHFREAFAKAPHARPMGAGRDLYGLRKDETEFPVEIGISPMNLAGEPLFLAVVIDITERKKFEHQQTLYFSIVNSSDDAILSKTLDGKIITWNKGAERVFGYTAQEMIGRDILTVIPSHLYNEEKEIIDKLQKGESVDHYETERLRKDGKIINVSLSISPIKDSNGTIVGASKICRDITEQKVIERTRLKRDFLANMSHELRTPMNAILGFSELLLDGKVGELNEKQLDYLRDIHASGTHLLQLINDVLDLSKIEAGKLQVRIEKFRVQDIAEEVVNVLKPIASKKEVRLHLGVGREINEVNIDKNKFRQILYNLISNAIKFNHPGGNVYVDIDLYGHESFQLLVKDTGIGISPENLPKLFTPFMQLDSAASRKLEGSGLGLALTKSIVSLQNGTINVSSVEDVGSTFKVILPMNLRKPTSDDRKG